MYFTLMIGDPSPFLEYLRIYSLCSLKYVANGFLSFGYSSTIDFIISYDFLSFL